MADAAEPLTLLDTPSQALERVIHALTAVGINLSPLLTQVFLLVLVVLLLIPRLRRTRHSAKKPHRLMITGALGLIALGILLSWGEQLLFPLPDHVYGHVKTPNPALNLRTVRVHLLDIRGVVLSTGQGTIDTQSGEFALRYPPALGNRPQALRITAPDCREYVHPLSRRHLRAGLPVTIDFVCRRNAL